MIISCRSCILGRIESTACFFIYQKILMIKALKIIGYIVLVLSLIIGVTDMLFTVEFRGLATMIFALPGIGISAAILLICFFISKKKNKLS